MNRFRFFAARFAFYFMSDKELEERCWRQTQVIMGMILLAEMTAEEVVLHLRTCDARAAWRDHAAAVAALACPTWNGIQAQ